MCWNVGAPSLLLVFFDVRCGGFAFRCFFREFCFFLLLLDFSTISLDNFFFRWRTSCSCCLLFVFVFSSRFASSQKATETKQRRPNNKNRNVVFKKENGKRKMEVASLLLISSFSLSSPTTTTNSNDDGSLASLSQQDPRRRVRIRGRGDAEASVHEDVWEMAWRRLHAASKTHSNEAVCLFVCHGLELKDDETQRTMNEWQIVKTTRCDVRSHDSCS